MIVESWSNVYISLPWRARGADRRGVDCYGLLRLVYRERLGLELVSYADRYVTADERVEIAAIIAEACEIGDWRRIAPGTERCFDVALFRFHGVESHLAIVTRPGVALHVDTHNGAHLIRYREQPWSFRLTGFCRHASMKES
jgi:cell wall-associated NlpC family hydrolase